MYGMNLMTKKPISIGPYSVGGTNECFIIAEMGSNHDGKISRAKNLIDIAGEAGCSAVKIQVVFSAECYPPNTKYPAHYGDEDLAEVIRRKEIPTEWVAELRKYTNDNGMLFGASTDGFIGLDVMLQGGVDFIKIPSFAISNIPLLLRASSAQLPVIIGTGVHTIGQVEEALISLGSVPKALLHCVSAYPASLEGLNLVNMQFYDDAFSVPVGFSDHSVHPTTAPGLAVALGANLLEKHYTYDRSVEGPDHFFAIEPKELFSMVQEVRKVENDPEYRNQVINDQDNVSLYGNVRRGIYEDEVSICERTRLGVYFLNDLSAGSILDSDDVRVFRCGNTEPELHPRYLDIVIGARLITDVSKYQPVSWKHVIEKQQ